METKQVIMMCKPDFYTVRYVINPWMTDNIGKTENPHARKQWDSLYQKIARHAEVRCIPAADEQPDMVFTANAALILNNIALMSSFRYPERQGEEQPYKEWLQKEGKNCHTPSCYFEGCGDALPDVHRRCIWFGYGIRSEQAAAHDIETLLNVECIPLHLVHTSFYHLDTCCCPLPGGYLLYYPPAFDEQSCARIDALVHKEYRIAVSDEDAAAFACNAVCIDNNIIINSVSSDLRNRLESIGFTVLETPLSEFIRAGGAARCLTLRLDESWQE